jgi:hypothetical protein
VIFPNVMVTEIVYCNATNPEVIALHPGPATGTISTLKLSPNSAVRPAPFNGQPKLNVLIFGKLPGGGKNCSVIKLLVEHVAPPVYRPHPL